MTAPLPPLRPPPCAGTASGRVTLISAAAHPDIINTVRTYCYGTGDELRVVPVKDGRTDPEALRQMLAGGDVSGVYIQQPNFFGQLEEAEALAVRSSIRRGASCIFWG